MSFLTRNARLKAISLLLSLLLWTAFHFNQSMKLRLPRREAARKPARAAALPPPPEPVP